MKYYLYDEKTKQFVKEQEGYLDPLESKAQGNDVYIVPPFSTTEKPNLSTLKDNEILVFKGDKWTVEQEFYVGKIVDCQDERVSNYVNDNDLAFVKCDEGFKIVEKPLPKEKTLEELKEEKHAELKAVMQSKRNALTCEYADDVFDCNEQAQSNMTSLMGFANLGMTEFSIRSVNEHTHTFNSAQLVELAMLMSNAVNGLYNEYWDLKNDLYECKTKEEINNIRWTNEN